MRYIIFLILLVLMGGAEAKYSPGLEIAEGANITLNGGYIVAPAGVVGNLSMGGYAVTDQIGSTDIVDVYRYDVPWLSSVAVAIRGDGLPVSAGSNDTVLAAAMAYDVVQLHDTFNISATLTQSKSIRLVGDGWHTGISGSVDPLFSSSIDPLEYVVVENMKIETGASNDGLKIFKTWDSVYVPSLHCDKVWFYAAGQGGSLLYTYGVARAQITDCTFQSTGWSDSWGKTAIGIEMIGNATAGVIDPGVHGCNFNFLNYGIKAVGQGTLLEGVRITNSMFIACDYGISLTGVNLAEITATTVDNCKYPGRFTDVTDLMITSSWFSTRTNSTDAIQVTGSNTATGTSDRFRITGTAIGSSASGTKASGISITSASQDVEFGLIHGCSITNAVDGIYCNTGSNKIQHCRFSSNYISCSGMGIFEPSGANYNIAIGNSIAAGTYVVDGGTGNKALSNYDGTTWRA